MQRINIFHTLQTASQLHGQGRLMEAEQLYKRVLAADRNNADALHLLGVLLHQTGRTTEGIDSIRRAIKRDPRAVQFHLNLANVYGDSKQPQRAAESLRNAIALEPRAIEPRLRLARYLNAELSRPREAVAAFRELLAIAPNLNEAVADLASALHQLGERAEALPYYESALSAAPDDVDLLSNYATALYELGDHERALPMFDRAIALQPRHEKLWYNLGLAHASRERFEDAVAAFKTAIEINPQHARAKFQLALLLCAARELEESADLHAQSLSTVRERADVYMHAGYARMMEGRNDKALPLHRKAIRIDPDYELAWQNLMMGLNYQAEDDAQLMIAEHRTWGQRHEGRYPARRFANDPSPERRLRIGYISPDFRSHSVSYFIEPVLANHDPQQVEIFCYANHARDDEVTARLKAYAHHWREIRGRSDDSVADMIQQDQIDLLIDLALHTGDNRLLVLARKPAPLQGTWLGYASTSGLKAIDFRLTDDWIDPPGSSEQYSVEQLIRLPQTQWVYRAAVEAPEVSPSPAEKNGTITFGVATNLAKINEPTIELWSKVLRATPGSILKIKAALRDRPSEPAVAESPIGRYGAEQVWKQLRQYLCELLAKNGISEDRLRLEGGSPLADYFQWHSNIDIILDTFPFAGGTTTCHALYMGVPVVTRTGNLSVSRVGSSILHNVGLGELVAQTPEQFTQIAIELAHDRPHLAEIRRTLRPRMQQSPLMDEPRFVGNLEAAYRQLWHAWCPSRAR
jgi:predicted O-linked N-acetylglucosamine transferase (SPINDLY family)